MKSFLGAFTLRNIREHRHRTEVFSIGTLERRGGDDAPNNRPIPAQVTGFMLFLLPLLTPFDSLGEQIMIFSGNEIIERTPEHFADSTAKHCLHASIGKRGVSVRVDHPKAFRRGFNNGSITLLTR